MLAAFVKKLALVMSMFATSIASADDRQVTIDIDASQTRDPIHPFIYGQFIEHLGRCVYGGIWAEMLEDRKFYFPVTAQYDPYKSLTDTDFPVVGASPWQIVGNADGVKMDAGAPFVGAHTPLVQAGNGIQQRDLAMVKGREYTGYIWLKGSGTAEIAMILGGEHSLRHPVNRFAISADYKKHCFQFTAPADSNESILQVRIEGDGAAHIGTLSLMPADNTRGMRHDTLALLKQLNAPMYRWPGGNFVSGYEWRDGIGPRDRRPPRKNPAWTGVEHNDVGVDEFIDFCRELNAEPLVAVNTGFGDPHSAAAQVEYCNGTPATYNGGLRASNGHPQPYGVKYWCVGNEMFGAWQLGYMQLAQYTLKHNRCAEAMRQVDSEIELIGVGELEGRDEKHDPDREYGWSETMLRRCAGNMDYISEHFYRGRVPWSSSGPSGSVAAHVDAMRSAIREKAEGHRQLQDRLGLTGNQRIPIAMDEWNYWHRDYYYGELGCRYDLSDALGVAVGLHEYFRNTDVIAMAHYAQTVNVIGCIKTTKTNAFFSTTALPLMLYRAHFGTTPVALTMSDQTYDIDAVAALTPNHNALTIGVVNPGAEPVTLELNLSGVRASGLGEQWVVTGEDPKAYNEVEMPRVAVAHDVANVHDRWTAPSYSFAVLRIPVEQY